MSDDCWPWPGKLKDGYGRIGQRRAHRVVYEQHVGPIPDGAILHHTCHNRACVNPSHLEVTTRSEHEDAWHRQLAARTHCNHGHPLDGVFTRRSGPRAGEVRRYCKTCCRERALRAYYARKRNR